MQCKAPWSRERAGGVQLDWAVLAPPKLGVHTHSGGAGAVAQPGAGQGCEMPQGVSVPEGKEVINLPGKK